MTCRTLACGILILTVLSVSVLSLTADEHQTETEKSDVPESSSWLSLGRDLSNLGLGSLDTSTGVLSDLKIGILDSLSNSNINPFLIFDRFLNQTRSTVPLIANHGNFTLLQAALLCAVGAMAAGAGAIALEAFYFKTVNDQTEAYHAQQAHYATNSAYGAPAYGAPAQPAYGAPAQPAYGAPAKPAYGVPAYSSRRDLKVPVRQIIIPPPHPTLSAKRLKPQSLRRTQRRNQRKNQASTGHNPNSKAGRKRRKRQANNYAYSMMVTPRPVSWTEYLTSYLYNPFQSYNYAHVNNVNAYPYSNANANSWSPSRSDSKSDNGWFNFHFANLNRNRNLINRSFQRFT